MIRRAALTGLASSGIAVGVLAEQQASAWPDLRDWLPDLLAGWTLIGLGIALLALHRPPEPAALLLLAGFTWFAFNFATTGPDAVQWLAERAAYLHRGPLFALALALPAGRPGTRLAAGGVALAWAAAVVWPLWDGDGTALVLSAAFLTVAAVGWAGARASGRRGRAIAGRGLAAAAVLAVAISADAVRSLVGASQGLADVTVLGYAAAVVLAGIVLYTAALLGAPASLAERAVALERGGTGLRDALRDLLGDAGLEVGFAVDSDTFVDDFGRPLVPPGTGRRTTPVTVAGQQVGVVVHDPSTLEDAATRSAVLAAVGLAAERARLRAEVDRQADAVEASRRRLLVAEEEERRRLAERLDRGAGAALADVSRLVGDVQPDGDVALAAALDRASEQLARVRPELDALVHGLGGVGAGGLVPALERLSEGLPFATRLELAVIPVSRELASALWFVCAESLANAVKHAGAQKVRVELVREGGIVRLSIEDDGQGGADAGGSGLVSLADRVSALGGRLVVVSLPGRGTRVVAELPVTGESN